MPTNSRDAAYHEVLPIDRSKAFDPELYPRDPDAYEPLDHFYQRQKEDERMLEKSLDEYSSVRETIRRGELRDNDDGCGVFVYDYHGVIFFIVVGYHLSGYRIAVSGWPVMSNRDQALASGNWTPNEIKIVEQFNREHEKTKQRTKLHA